jgi:hypothetical protein
LQVNNNHRFILFNVPLAFQQKQSVESSASTPVLAPPNIAPITIPQPGQVPTLQQQQSIDSPQSISALPGQQHQQLQPVPSGGKRGRKPGSKNRPKSEKAATKEAPKREYDFNSEDEHSSEPMTYDEKRQLSMDINMLTADKLSTYGRMGNVDCKNSGLTAL